MNQIATVPLELRQRMSLLPSPLKSPVSMIDQSVGTFATPTDWMSCAPFISQIATVPVLASRHRMSDEPLPSKSPVPTMTQLDDTTPRLALVAMPRPNTCQTTSAPVLLSRQNTLPRRSTAAITQLFGTTPIPPICWIERVSISQMATVPVLPSRHSKSQMPSLLKSRWPTICQLVGTVPTFCTEEMGEGWDGGFSLCISHLAMAPSLRCQTMSLT